MVLTAPQMTVFFEVGFELGICFGLEDLDQRMHLRYGKIYFFSMFVHCCDHLSQPEGSF
jgi:hypothetical protein